MITSRVMPSSAGMVNVAWLAGGSRALSRLPSTRQSPDWPCAKRAITDCSKQEWMSVTANNKLRQVCMIDKLLVRGCFTPFGSSLKRRVVAMPIDAVHWWYTLSMLRKRCSRYSFVQRVIARYCFQRTTPKGGLACVAGEQGRASRPDSVARNSYQNTLTLSRLDHRCLQR
jgi:hypothetical protein